MDPETGHAAAKDGSIAVIGGIITSKNLKITKNNQTMAFLTLEDLTGTIEIIVFPKDYENNRSMLEEEKRVFIRGRVTHGEDAVGKLVCERVIEFSPWPKELWVKFADKAAFDDGARSPAAAGRRSGGYGIPGEGAPGKARDRFSE